MTDQSNTKLLKQLTTRKRDPNATRDYIAKSPSNAEAKKKAAEEERKQ